MASPAPAAAAASPPAEVAPTTSTEAAPASPPAAAAPASAASPTAAASPPAPAAARIEVDNQPLIEHDLEENDTDSALDERLSAYTASLTSSVVDYPVEHGRRFHAFRPGVYTMPNDEKEMDRLDLHHHMVVLALGKKLFTAPIDKAKTHRVLDIGTGTGIWAIEVGDILPGAEILGNDLSAIQPAWVPPNVKFEVDDVESEWTHPAPFDYIFCRYLIGSISDWPKLVKKTFDNIRPGGFVEFQDYDLLIYSEDGSMTKEHHTYKWVTTTLNLLGSLGRIGSPGPFLEQWVRDAGFVNVTHKRIKLPLGPWAKDPDLKEVGTCNLIQTLSGLEGFSIRMLCGVGGWSMQEVNVLLAKVREEMKRPGMHQQYDLHVVVGQKPE